MAEPIEQVEWVEDLATHPSRPEYTAMMGGVWLEVGWDNVSEEWVASVGAPGGGLMLKPFWSLEEGKAWAQRAAIDIAVARAEAEG